MRMHIEIETFGELVSLAHILHPMTHFAEVGEPQTTAADPAPEPEPAPAPKKARAKANGAAKPEPAPEPEEPIVEPEPEAEEETMGTSGEGNPFADDEEKEPPKAKARKAKKVTKEDAIGAFTRYVDTFGQAAAMEDVTKILSRIFPGVKKIRDMPEGEANWTKAVKAVETVIETNEFGREAVNA